MRASWLLTILPVLTLTLLSCSNDTSAESDPWIVTGVQFTLGDGPRFVLEADYTAPGGRDGHWRYEVTSEQTAKGITDDPFYRCWKQARVGDPLPDCLRSFTSN